METTGSSYPKSIIYEAKAETSKPKLNSNIIEADVLQKFPIATIFALNTQETV